MATALLSATAQAGPVQVIDDKSFFDSIPHTLIDFETRGDGTPIVLDEGRFIPLDYDDYVGQGVSISGPTPLTGRNVILANDLSLSVGVAQSIVGSLDNLMAEPNGGFIRFDFIDPVTAVGIAVIQPSNRPLQSMSFLDTHGNLLLDLQFERQLIDDVILGADFDEPFDIAYGFIGIHALDCQIGSLIVPSSQSAFDDLLFSVVPEPPIWMLVIAIAIAFVSRQAMLARQQSRRGGIPWVAWPSVASPCR